MGKSQDEVFALLENIATNNYKRPKERMGSKRLQSTHEIHAFSVINARLDTLVKPIDKLSVHSVQLTLVAAYEIYGAEHKIVDCQGVHLVSLNRFNL